MRLDRNITKPKRGKYALIKLRESAVITMDNGEKTCVPSFAVDYGNTPDTDFFVIRLKDKYASSTLNAYAKAADEDGEPEYANEVRELARLAENSPCKKRPD